MKKREIVKSNILFNEIISKGNKVSNSLFSIFYIETNNDNPLFGISAPKKLGNAVIRNKVKRQTRALVDQLKLLFKKNKNYIIIVKNDFLRTNYNQKFESLKNLIGEIDEK